MARETNANVCLFIVMVPLVMTGVAFGSDYYVSPAGSNVTGDGSFANPWRTIQYSIGNIYENDATLYVGAGTYAEQVIVPSIASGIDIIGAGADVTTIDASSITHNGGTIRLPQGDGFTISGFTITGGTYEGSGSHGGAIRGFSTDNFSESLSSAVVENNIIIGNYSYGYACTGGGVTLGTNTVIRNNAFINNSSRYGSGAVYVGANSLVEGNMFIENLGYQSDSNSGGGAVEADSVSIVVRGNIFQENSSGQGSSGWGGAFHGQATVYNNLFIGNSTQSYNDGYGGAAYLTGGLFVNNTLVGNIGDKQGDASGVYAKAGATVANNIIVGGLDGVGIFSEGSISADYNNIWNNDLGQYDGDAFPGAHDIHANPLFVSSDDYHLQKGSPCIDAAGDFGIYSDIEGNKRPFDVPGVDNNGEVSDFDMGASEFITDIPGDATRDGKVTAADVAVLATYWQTGTSATWEMGDFNGDGAVNDIDATLLAANWDSDESDAVPEPSTLAGLLGLCLLGLLGSARCKH